MTTFLLDANVLIALTVAEHEFHDRVARWRTPEVAVALCPVVEGALVRFLVRQGDGAATALAILHRVQSIENCAFWSDDISYADLDLGHVVGHRQVTDSYLAGLATAHGGKLATLDRALATTLPESTFLIPN